MSALASEIESLLAEVKAKLGAIPADVEGFFSSQAESAKAAEAEAQALRDKVQAEIDHLRALGYTVAAVENGPIA